MVLHFRDIDYTYTYYAHGVKGLETVANNTKTSEHYPRGKMHEQEKILAFLHPKN